MNPHLVIFGLVMLASWPVVTLLLVIFWPRLVISIYKRAVLTRGFGDGPIPVNTLYVEPPALFAQPLAARSTAGSNLMTVGVNHDTLAVVGWLDLSQEPQVLHVPEFSGRYYSIQFTDPFNVNFAYVGTRTTGTQSRDFLITGPGWKGQIPAGLSQVASPNDAALILGRVLVYSDDDLAAAASLSRQMHLTPLGCWQRGR